MIKGENPNYVFKKKTAVGADPNNATSKIGKIRPLSKIAVTFEPIIQFRYSLKLKLILN